MVDKRQVTFKAWATTKYNLKLLAAMRGETMSATLHELVSEALDGEDAERDRLAPMLFNLIDFEVDAEKEKVTT